MDIAALIGTFLGIGFILTGQALEGGNIGQLLQITAAFIVVGGTAGAVFLSFPVEDFKTAAHCVGVVYFGKSPNCALLSSLETVRISTSHNNQIRFPHNRTFEA